MFLNFKAEHKRIHLWLAKNPLFTKRDWPGWKHNGGLIPITKIKQQCFGCTAARIEYKKVHRSIHIKRGQNQFSAGICEYCPIETTAYLQTGVKSCFERHGAIGPIMLRTKDLAEKRSLALDIAGLDWKQDFYEI